jgi:hypothetical protein
MVLPHPAVIANIKRELDQTRRQNPDLDVLDFLKSIGLEPGYNPVGKDNPAKINKSSLAITYNGNVWSRSGSALSGNAPFSLLICARAVFARLSI